MLRSPTTNWITLTNALANAGTNSTVVMPVALGGQEYYRLTLP